MNFKNSFFEVSTFYNPAGWGMSTLKLTVTCSFLLVSIFSYGQPGPGGPPNPGSPNPGSPNPGYISNGGRFEVDQVKGCAPFTVNITATNLTPGNSCPVCAMTFEPGNQVPNTLTWTYNTPGSYLLSVLYQNTGADNITITVLPNIQPDFQIFTCSGNRVTINITDKNYDKYYIDFGDGSPKDSIPSGNNQVDSHGYPGTGFYNISIHGRKLNAADNCSAKVQNFHALPVLPTPKITALTCVDPNSLTLDFPGLNPNLDLHMEIAVNNSTTFQLFQTLYGISVDTIHNLTVDQNYYCFRLSAYDPCTGANTYSNIICSQIFTVTPQSDVDQLAWITSTTGLVANYNITRNGAAYVTTPIATTNYNDVDIMCQTNYCYQIISNYGGGVQSISLTKCVTAFSSKVPTLIENCSAVVSDTGVDLTWLQDPNFVPTQYFVLRQQNGGSFQSIASATTMEYNDPAYTTQGNFCYRINYIDQCGNNSAQGASVCPIRLTGSLEKTNAIDLSWSNYQGWRNGVNNYSLKKSNLQGTSSVPMGTQTSYTDTVTDKSNQVVSYQVVASPNDAGLGLLLSVSNVVTLIKETNLWYPTAFTPNGDGKNDTFTVNGFYITKLELSVFNRWGTLIFSTDKSEPWDGTFNGKMMPNDTYVWTAKGTDLAGQSFSKSGTVILLTPAR